MISTKFKRAQDLCDEVIDSGNKKLDIKTQDISQRFDSFVNNKSSMISPRILLGQVDENIADAYSHVEEQEEYTHFADFDMQSTYIEQE